MYIFQSLKEFSKCKPNKNIAIAFNFKQVGHQKKKKKKSLKNAALENIRPDLSYENSKRKSKQVEYLSHFHKIKYGAL